VAPFFRTRCTTTTTTVVVAVVVTNTTNSWIFLLFYWYDCNIIYTVSGKKDQNVSCNIFYKNVQFWIMSLNYNVKLEMVTRMCYHWVVRERNATIYPVSTVACKFARFEFNWLQCVENATTEGVHNTHHWPGRTETATDWGQSAGSGQSWITSLLRRTFLRGMVAYQRAPCPMVDILGIVWLSSLHC